MGGIAGIYGQRGSFKQLETMAEAIDHRGCIDQQWFTDSDFEQESILFNGALVNREMCSDSITDADYALDCYKTHGDRCVAKLEGTFAFAIHDPNRGLVLGRDSLGVVPLYVGQNDGTWYFASEIKALADRVSKIEAIPPGALSIINGSQQKHFLTDNKEGLDASGLDASKGEVEEAIRTELESSIERILYNASSMGVYLSGGLDSSIIASIVSEEIPGVKSFCVGMKGSPDLSHARLCADKFGTDHYEYSYDLEDMLSVLPDVIYHLESYDMALVRSSIPNYMLARLASEHVDQVCSGEGADELFCGYEYMKGLPPEQLLDETDSLLRNLHNTGLQRGDRMSAAFGLEANVPFLSKEMILLAHSIPPQMKINCQGVEKWILRTAFADQLPPEVARRKKQKFSIGAGSFSILEDYAKETYGDGIWAPGTVTPSGHRITTYEEGLYYDMFKSVFPQQTIEATVGHTEFV
ncbi:MAG: asparagine synthetase B [Firmicutes bacterium HGW-Firmicutes-11]|jgi:asparagine synthase (glutamine-hydrolysing)|nr:MAG: asparagine synthetase B [Firmicutes bacterium HGW-Firmicutes-11]